MTWKWWRKSRTLSHAAEDARQRLLNVCHDDERIDQVAQKRQEIIQENHLGMIIAQALRGHKT